MQFGILAISIFQSLLIIMTLYQAEVGVDNDWSEVTNLINMHNTKRLV